LHQTPVYLSASNNCLPLAVCALPLLPALPSFAVLLLASERASEREGGWGGRLERKGGEEGMREKEVRRDRQKGKRWVEVDQQIS